LTPISKQQPAAEHGANNADDEIAHDGRSSPPRRDVGEPARDQTHEKYDQNRSPTSLFSFVGSLKCIGERRLASVTAV
jgi:hypothetical protein